MCPGPTQDLVSEMSKGLTLGVYILKKLPRSGLIPVVTMQLYTHVCFQGLALRQMGENRAERIRRRKEGLRTEITIQV